jgi:hypothetical protein
MVVAFYNADLLLNTNNASGHNVVHQSVEQEVDVSDVFAEMSRW